MNLEDIMNQLGVEKYDVIQLITVLSVIKGMKKRGKGRCETLQAAYCSYEGRSRCAYW